ncbi:MAG: hypothetical protein FWD51_03310 [Betaproteobacteria bacterium]|nr:hypothetical protein [Betaproteobacteria bacterium]
MKHLFVCLLAGCLASPAWGEEFAVTFEEFLQKLEKAEPWTREKVEALMGVKLSEREPHDRGSHRAYGQFMVAKGIIVREIALEVSGITGKTNILRLYLDDKSGCFTGKQVRELYPGGYVEMAGPGAGGSYIKEMPWGELDFAFGPEKEYRCMTDIGIRTNAFIERYRD